MKIGIVDADLLGRSRHRFPNLACEKISGYWKAKGAEVTLVDDYNALSEYDQVYVSKVFTDTPVPCFIKETSKIHLGGTGFFFDESPDLPEDVEHHMPDYHLYDDWISNEVSKAEILCSKKGIEFNIIRYMQQFKEYTDYSIGFITRGCFRKCKFCVNKKYNKVIYHCHLGEFLDATRKKICLLDDNIFGFPNWKNIFADLNKTGKYYKFKQGLDIRLLTSEKCRTLFMSNYDGDFTFAFDNVSEFDIIQKKLKLIRKHSTSKTIKFYILVGFEDTGANDIINAFVRISLLMQYKCLPYIMRYRDIDRIPWKESKYKDMYVALARWCNQPRIFKKMSFRQFCEANQSLHKSGKTLCASMQALQLFEKEYPLIGKEYFDRRFEDF